MSSSASGPGARRRSRARRPAGIAARSRQIAPRRRSSSGPPASTRASISGSRSARLVLTSMPTAEVTITSAPAGSAAQNPADRVVDGARRRRRARARARPRRGVEARLVELREVPELVAGEVRGAEREPGEVEVLVGEQLLGERRRSGPAPRRSFSRSASRSRARGRPKISVASGPRPRRRSNSPADVLRARPAGQHDPVVEPPAADEASRPRRCGGRLSYGSIASVRSPARGEPLPDRRRRLERRRVARALVGRRPLERIEDPVVAELDAAVERVEGAGGEVDRRRLELEPAPTLASAARLGSRPAVEQPLERRDARGVELQDADHVAGLGAATQPRLVDHRITRAPSAALASRPRLRRRGSRRRTAPSWSRSDCDQRVGAARQAAGERRHRPAGAARSRAGVRRRRGRGPAPGAGGRSRSGCARARGPVSSSSSARSCEIRAARTRAPPTPESRARGRRGAGTRSVSTVLVDASAAATSGAGSRARARARAARRRAAAPSSSAPCWKRRLKPIHGAGLSAASRSAPASAGAGGFSTRAGSPAAAASSAWREVLDRPGWRSPRASTSPAATSSRRRPVRARSRSPRGGELGDPVAALRRPDRRRRRARRCSSPASAGR